MGAGADDEAFPATGRRGPWRGVSALVAVASVVAALAAMPGTAWANHDATHASLQIDQKVLDAQEKFADILANLEGQLADASDQDERDEAYQQASEAIDDVDQEHQGDIDDLARKYPEPRDKADAAMAQVASDAQAARDAAEDLYEAASGLTTTTTSTTTSTTTTSTTTTTTTTTVPSTTTTATVPSSATSTTTTSTTTTVPSTKTTTTTTSTATTTAVPSTATTTDPPPGTAGAAGRDGAPPVDAGPVGFGLSETMIGTPQMGTPLTLSRPPTAQGELLARPVDLRAGGALRDAFDPILPSMVLAPAVGAVTFLEVLARAFLSGVRGLAGPASLLALATVGLLRNVWVRRRSGGDGPSAL